MIYNNVTATDIQIRLVSPWTFCCDDHIKSKFCLLYYFKMEIKHTKVSFFAGNEANGLFNIDHIGRKLSSLN